MITAFDVTFAVIMKFELVLAIIDKSFLTPDIMYSLLLDEREREIRGKINIEFICRQSLTFVKRL